jgi:hypothetical protein
MSNDQSRKRYPDPLPRLFPTLPGKSLDREGEPSLRFFCVEREELSPARRGDEAYRGCQASRTYGAILPGPAVEASRSGGRCGILRRLGVARPGADGARGVVWGIVRTAGGGRE